MKGERLRVSYFPYLPLFTPRSVLVAGLYWAIEPESFSCQPGHRRHLIVNMRGKGLANEKKQTLYGKLVDNAALDIGVAACNERGLHALRGERVQSERDELVLNVPAGKISASIHRVELIPRANIENEFSAFLDHFPAEVLVLDADDEQGWLIGDPQRAEGKLDIAFSLPGRRDEIKACGCGAVRLKQRDFMQHMISVQVAGVLLISSLV